MVPVGRKAALFYAVDWVE